jgi:protein TonB
MRGAIWMAAAAVSIAANASFAALVATHEPAPPAPRPPILMRLAPPPPKPVAPPAPPPPVELPKPPPPRPQLVKKLAPRPQPARAPEAPPPPAPKIGVSPDASSADGLAVASGTTTDGELGTGTTMDKVPPPPVPEPVAPPAPPPPPAAKPTGKRYVPIFQVTRMPKAIHPVAPEIPQAFRDAPHEALVVIEVELDEHGHVTAAKVIRAAGSGLDEAALAAAHQTDFEPALVGTQAVAVRYQIPYRFRVRG